MVRTYVDGTMNNSFISIVWNSSRFLFNASCFNMHSSECKWSRKIIPAIRIIFRQAPWNKSACDLFIRCSLSTSHNRRISISSPSFVSHCNHLFFFSFLFFFIYSTPRSSFRIFLDFFFFHELKSFPYLQQCNSWLIETSLFFPPRVSGQIMKKIRFILLSFPSKFSSNEKVSSSPLFH